MTKGNAQSDPCVMVVGDPHSETARVIVRLAQEYQVRTVPCDDMYMAVARLTAVGRRVLLAGRIQDLARENGSLFAFAAARDIRCCCLLEKRPGLARESLRAALRAGAALIFEAQEARGVFADWLAGSPRRAACAPVRGLSEEDLEATEAELGALLGQQSEA